MKVFLLMTSIDGAGYRRRCKVPHEECEHVVVLGEACPCCAVDPFKVQGTGKRPSVDDRAWEADAICLACSKFVGVLRAEMNTLFGVCEDEAVFNGRCRVY